MIPLLLDPLTRKLAIWVGFKNRFMKTMSVKKCVIAIFMVAAESF